MRAREPFTLRRIFLIQRYLDGAALRRELQGVGKKIQKHLTEPHAVRIDVLGQNIVDVYVELLLSSP